MESFEKSPLTSVALGLDVAHSRKSKGCDSKSSGSPPVDCVCFDIHLLSPVARTVTVDLLRLSFGAYGRRKSVWGVSDVLSGMSLLTYLVL